MRRDVSDAFYQTVEMEIEVVIIFLFVYCFLLPLGLNLIEFFLFFYRDVEV